jgi:hypothetical protein
MFVEGCCRPIPWRLHWQHNGCSMSRIPRLCSSLATIMIAPALPHDHSHQDPLAHILRDCCPFCLSAPLNEIAFLFGHLKLEFGLLPV